MKQRRLDISEIIRRVWWRMRGEQPLLSTFWPQDYRRGDYYQLAGRYYCITRYFHAADYRFFEVWGRDVGQQPPTHGTVIEPREDPTPAHALEPKQHANNRHSLSRSNSSLLIGAVAWRPRSSARRDRTR